MGLSGDARVIAYLPQPNQERFLDVSILRTGDKLMAVSGGKMKAVTVKKVIKVKNIIYDVNPARCEALRVTSGHPLALEGSPASWLGGQKGSLDRFSNRPNADKIGSHMSEKVVQSVKDEKKQEWGCGTLSSALEHAVAFRLFNPTIPEAQRKTLHAIVTGTTGFRPVGKMGWAVKWSEKDDEGKLKDKTKTFSFKAVEYNKQVRRPDLKLNLAFDHLAREAVTLYNQHILQQDNGQSRPVYKSISPIQGIGLNLMVRYGRLVVQSLYEIKRSAKRHFFAGPELEVETVTPDGKNAFAIPDTEDLDFDLATLAQTVALDFETADPLKAPVMSLTLEQLDAQPAEERQSWGFRRPDTLEYPGKQIKTAALPLHSWYLGAHLGDGLRSSGNLVNAHQEEMLRKMLDIAKEMGGDLLYLGGLQYGIYKGNDPRIIRLSDLDQHLLEHAAGAAKAIRAAPVAGKTKTWHVRAGTLVYEFTGVETEAEARQVLVDIVAAQREGILPPDDVGKGVTAEKGSNLIRPKLQELGILQPSKTGGAADTKHIPTLYFQTSAENKSAVLAGLIDTHGHLKQSPKSSKHVITQSLNWHRRVLEDAAVLAQMLGHSVQFFERPPVAYRVVAPDGRVSEGISGASLADIPTALSYKRAANRTEKDAFFYPIKSVVPGNALEFCYDIYLNDEDAQLLRHDFILVHPRSLSPENPPKLKDRSSSSSDEIGSSRILEEWIHPHYSKAAARYMRKGKEGEEDEDEEEEDDDEEEEEEVEAEGMGGEVGYGAGAANDDQEDNDADGDQVIAFAKNIQRFKRPPPPPPLKPNDRIKKKRKALADGAADASFAEGAGVAGEGGPGPATAAHRAVSGPSGIEKLQRFRYRKPDDQDQDVAQV
ncbi:pre-mRNA-splicing factor 8 [Rhodotorula toruloides]